MLSRPSQQQKQNATSSPKKPMACHCQHKVTALNAKVTDLQRQLAFALSEIKRLRRQMFSVDMLSPNLSVPVSCPTSPSLALLDSKATASLTPAHSVSRYTPMNFRKQAKAGGTPVTSVSRNKTKDPFLPCEQLVDKS